MDKLTYRELITQLSSLPSDQPSFLRRDLTFSRNVSVSTLPSFSLSEE